MNFTFTFTRSSREWEAEKLNFCMTQFNSVRFSSDSIQVIQQFQTVLVWKQKVQWPVHKAANVFCSESGSVHTITLHSLKTHFNIIPVFLTPPFPSGSPSKVPTHISDFFICDYVLSTSFSLHISPKYLVKTAKYEGQQHVHYYILVILSLL